MQASTNLSAKRAIAGALDWWREAGVDCAFSDEPEPWLAEEEPEQAKQTSAAPLARQPVALPPPVELPKFGGDKAAWPQDLAAFDAWWMSEPSLDTGLRIPPRGPPGAKLMVLVEQPEAQDSESLLSGPQGKLLSAMLQAMGIAQDEVRLASVLPCFTPSPDWQPLGASGIADLLLHHLQISAPQRLIVFGSNIPPLLGHDPAQSPANLPNFNHEGRIIPLLADRSLDALTRAKAKSAFWQRWLDWSGT